MGNDNYYTIEIYTEDSQKPSLIDGIKSLQTLKTPKKEEDDPPIMISNIKKEKKDKKPKKKKSVLIFDDLDISDTSYDESDNKKSKQEIDEDILLDVESIMREREEYDEDIEGDLTTKGKKGYKDLKKNKNNYKKEFAEELTLLYSLLEDTNKFGKSLEKDLNSLKGSKVRGVSKYTNELAQLVLTAKQNKLNILKEINATKKTIADLTIKAEAKTNTDDSKNSPEHLASAYFKNVLMHGRGNFIDNMTNTDLPQSYDYDDDYDDMINQIEAKNEETDEDIYNRILTERLNASGNPHRSVAGTKYIEYENRGVKLYVKKCVDTGEWDFVAIDRNKQQIDDYPVPTKREAGRMKFSDDGSYATDSKGRIYNVIEYFLPEE